MRRFESSRPSQQVPDVVQHVFRRGVERTAGGRIEEDGKPKPLIVVQDASTGLGASRSKVAFDRDA
jgi:hypothetical protein